MKMPQMIPVVSSNLKSYGYEPESETLVVAFKFGTYAYFGVPERVFDVFTKAESKGKYLNEHIKKAGYKYEKLQ